MIEGVVRGLPDCGHAVRDCVRLGFNAARDDSLAGR